MIAEAITRWLSQEGRQLDEGVRTATASRLAKRFANQFLRDRETRPGRLSTTTVSKDCSLFAWNSYKGTPQVPLPARALLQFWVGDIIEASVLELAQAAGVPILENNAELAVTRDGFSVPIHPDGRLADGSAAVEIKKVNARTYAEICETGEISNAFGYLTQASLGVEAFRQAGCSGMDRTEFVVVSPDRMEIKSVVARFDPTLVDAAMERAKAGVQHSPPPIPKHLLPGKDRKLKILCAGCAFRPVCWPQAKGSGWSWYIPTREKAAA